MNVWKVLEIAPTKDISAIRAAYAQLAKLHHPEDDPERFVRLREAYKQALRMAKAGSAPEAAPPRPASPPAPARPPKSTTDTLNFSGVQQAGSQKPGAGQTGDAEESLDFSGVRPTGSQKPDTGQTEDAEESLNFSGVRQASSQKPDAGQTGGFEQALDFSDLDNAIAQKQRRQSKDIETFIAKARALYATRKTRRSREAWEQLLDTPDARALQQSEEFTWAFLDFLVGATRIPDTIWEEVVLPWVREWRAYWQNSELWAEFEVVDNILDAHRKQQKEEAESLASALAALSLRPVKRKKPEAWNALFQQPDFVRAINNEFYVLQLITFFQNHNQYSRAVWRQAHAPEVRRVLERWGDTSLGESLEKLYRRNEKFHNMRLQRLLLGLLAASVLVYLFFLRQ